MVTQGFCDIFIYYYSMFNSSDFSRVNGRIKYSDRIVTIVIDSFCNSIFVIFRVSICLYVCRVRFIIDGLSLNDFLLLCSISSIQINDLT